MRRATAAMVVWTVVGGFIASTVHHYKPSSGVSFAIGMTWGVIGGAIFLITMLEWAGTILND